MAMSITKVDLGPCSAIEYNQDADRWAIVLPGAGYSTDAPLLWFAREAALAGGRNVLAVRDAFDPGREEPVAWVAERARAALSHIRAADDHPLLITKSLTSLAAPLAAEERLPGVWLTPLIRSREASIAEGVLEGLRGATGPSLLVGGSADPTWDGATARSIEAAEVLEVADGDHALQVPGAPTRSLAVLATVTDRIAAFLASLPGAGEAARAVVRDLDHVQLAMPSGGEPQARAFYGELLGLTEVEKPPALTGPSGCWFVGTGRLHLHIGVDDHFRPATKAHPAFVVADPATLRARLEASRVTVVDDRTEVGINRFYVTDPFGNRIEIVALADAGFTDGRPRSPRSAE